MLTKLQFDMSDLKQQINALHFKFSGNNNHLTNPDTLNIDLPIKTIEELYNVESILPEKKDSLVKIISLVGGNSIRHYITLMLKKLLSTNFALEYSGRGRKGKRSFASTKLYPVLIDAVRLRYSEATDITIGQLIGLSLATANDWDGCNRKPKKNNENEIVLNNTDL
ncbi:hypothetical protein FQR65_LT15732 [Abscondita terminalis]|nr:hypothetical protein FQR65_LT15732 [Abscondita terminalis]